MWGLVWSVGEYCHQVLYNYTSVVYLFYLKSLNNIFTIIISQVKLKLETERLVRYEIEAKQLSLLIPSDLSIIVG